MTFQRLLLEWFQKNQRPLPWRKHYRPYEVWVSEIMLQQTQMDTVLPYFKRWMKAFPTLASLARADSSRVLKLWEGLGYYSRARNLHQTAKLLMEKYDGRFPSDYETILSLKGIGRYTAGAISSIAFNQEKPIVDGNIFRVLSRLYSIKKPIDVEKNKEAFWRLQENLIPIGEARHFNQALMELGALVCASQNPACALCPVRTFCSAFKKGNPEDYPVKKNKKRILKVRAQALVLKHNGKFLIRLRPLGQLMGGLWEFPEQKLARKSSPGPLLRRSEAPASQRRAAAVVSRRAHKFRAAGALLRVTRRTLLTRLAQDKHAEDKNNGFRNLKPLGIIQRNYTHHNETLEVFSADLEEARSVAGTWVRPSEFKNYPFSSAHAKIVKLLLKRP